MRSIVVASFIPAAIFVPTVLTLVYRRQREKWLVRRLRQTKIPAPDQATAPVTEQSSSPQPISREPEPIFREYETELAAVLADLRREPAPRR